MIKDKKRRVGRPRAKKRDSDLPARQAILLAAANLFAEQGYSATTTRQIADAVGIRQPSLFYHFGKKEDLLLGIISEVASLWDGFLTNLESNGGTPAVRLYRLMIFDFMYLMTEPYRVGELIALPEVRNGPFSKTPNRVRRRIIRGYRSLLEEGVEHGEFVAMDGRIVSRTIFAMGESVWFWHVGSGKRQKRRVAEQIADLVMRGVLARRSRLEAIKSRVKAEKPFDHSG